MRRSLFSCLAVMLVAGCSNGVSLIVTLKTDMLPALEFAAVRVEIFAGSTTEGEPELVMNAPALGDFRAGVQVAEQTGLSAGPHTVRVALISSEEELILDGFRLVEVEAATVLTLLLTRNCRGVACPEPGGDPALTACVGGRCTNPTCSAETPEPCRDPQCTEAVDCPAPTSSCARAECDATGVCLTNGDSSLCRAGQVCDPLLGCFFGCEGGGEPLTFRSTGFAAPPGTRARLAILLDGTVQSRFSTEVGPGGEVALVAVNVAPGTYTLRLFIDLDEDDYCDAATDLALQLDTHVHPGGVASIDPGEPTSAAVCPSFALYGDLNLDGCVDDNDVSVLQGSFGRCLPNGLSADVNSDGIVDGIDLGLVINSIATAGLGCGGRCLGDVNGDRVVTTRDLEIINANISSCVAMGRAECEIYDVNGDGNVLFSDVGFANTRLGPCCVGDATNDGVVDAEDEAFISMNDGCMLPAGFECISSDVDGSGVVDAADVAFVMERFRTCG